MRKLKEPETLAETLDARTECNDEPIEETSHDALPPPEAEDDFETHDQFDELAANATMEQRQRARLSWERKDREDAERMRNLADEAVRIAQEMLEDAEQKADELRARADALDGGNTVLRPKAKGVDKEIDALIDELPKIPIDESPKPKRTRKPKAEKPAKPARKAKRGKRVMAPKTPKAPKPSDLDDHDQKILKVASKGALGVAALAEKCGLQQPYTARKCKKLVALKLLVTSGKNRSMRYEAA